MKNLLLILTTLFGFNTSAQQGGACVYMLPDSTMVCYVTGNAGIPHENTCMSTAIAAGALPIDCLDNPFALCASFYATNGVACFYGGTGACGGGSACDILSPLPVELVEFTGVIQDGVVVLNWTTATELNNYYFIVGQSIDGFIYNDIVIIDGAGTTMQEHKYRVIHETPAIGVSYYRLKQIDFDGAFEYHNIISVDNKSNLYVVRMVNTLGQNVDLYYTGLVIVVYSDGSTEKVFRN